MKTVCVADINSENIEVSKVLDSVRIVKLIRETGTKTEVFIYASIKVA